ncbi:MAG: YkgJ family cysteine cluster protein [Syntrophaceae bacterium]
MRRFGMIFTKVQFPDFDIYLPFQCQMCGSCCSRYMPRFSWRDLLELSIYYGASEHDLFRSYEQSFSLQLKGRETRCIFMRGTACSIYEHRLRPQACILFPFSFQYANIRDCPGHDVHLQLLHTMLKGESGYSIFDSSFCPAAPFRAPPETQANKFWGRFIGLRPSPMLVRKYLVINELQQPSAADPSEARAQAVQMFTRNN